jgi:hypothetical protein
MSQVAEQAEFLRHVCLLIDMATKAGFVVTGGELYRTPEQQQIHVRAGRSKTMASNHLRRCAIDLNFFIDGKLCYDVEKLRPLGEFWRGLHPKNDWGGFWRSFKDAPHFERRP